MDWLTTLTTALGSAWLSGINLYATVATLGLLQRLGLARLPGDLTVLSHGWIIALAVGLYVIEFVADKIPVVDSVWDAVHTFVRVPAGAILAASAFADFDPPVRVAALLVGGGLALGSHGGKAVTRVAVNTAAPGAGAVVSVAEDAVAVGSTALMTFFPLVFLGLLVLLLIGTAWLVPRIVRTLRRIPALLRGASRDASTPSPRR
ncbi:MAG: DUF4126 domain-containing protein [Candidatus Rokuibacteriota bacterium]|nr:MAG: DUF4126 domain-containing protein [Candidatus Rokubacteria bacterium]PYO54560.1 MAG: DUF4126 domain-containing protein [Candidatus Rokubacteria bacterium]